MRGIVLEAHDALKPLLEGKAKCRSNPDTSAACFSPTCKNGKGCSEDLSKALIKLMYSVYTLFNQEQSTMILYNIPGEHFEAH